MASKTQKMHDVSPKENLDRFFFIMAFVVGVGGGIMLKLAGAPALVSASFSAVVLLFYAFKAWTGGRLQIEPETIGDNCYYLGFLFTLASLAFTLYQMSEPSANSGKPIEIPAVISGFGVALSSTIVGVFLRVLMMQMRTDFVAKDKAIRVDLDRAYADFRRNLSGTLSQLKAFSTESIQYAAERDQRLRDATESFVGDYRASLQQSADTLAENMEKSFGEASKKAIEDIAASVSEANDQYRQVFQELSTEVQSLKEKLRDQEAESLKSYAARRSGLVAEIEATDRKLHEYTKSIGDYAAVSSRVANTMSQEVMPALDALKSRLEVPPVDAPFTSSPPVKEQATEDTNNTLRPVSTRGSRSWLTSEKKD